MKLSSDESENASHGIADLYQSLKPNIRNPGSAVPEKNVTKNFQLGYQV